jgi:putative GTP pyrophosphokinase
MQYTAQEIQDLIALYEQLEPVVLERINNALSRQDGRLYHITHRIKTADSIRGKLERKPDEYPDLYSIRDILGVRIICYFSDEVDEAAKLVSEVFRIDWSKSKDKRELIKPDAFGYLSLHYICSLPENLGYPEQLSSLLFEVQMRTMLQHTWAEIEHDLGYKTEFGIPRAIRRSFSRVASLLEVADQNFSDIKNSIAAYKAEVRANIDSDNADNMYLDVVTLTEFMKRSHIYRKLLSDIASITNAHITDTDSENQLQQLSFFKINTLGDLVCAIKREYSQILSLAEERLRDSELDELSSTVAFYYLYQALLISGNYSPERISEFFALRTNKESSIKSNTERIVQKIHALKVYDGEVEP